MRWPFPPPVFKDHHPPFGKFRSRRPDGTLPFSTSWVDPNDSHIFLSRPDPPIREIQISPPSPYNPLSSRILLSNQSRELRSGPSPNRFCQHGMCLRVLLWATVWFNHYIFPKPPGRPVVQLCVSRRTLVGHLRRVGTYSRWSPSPIRQFTANPRKLVSVLPWVQGMGYSWQLLEKLFRRKWQKICQDTFGQSG